MKAEKLTWGAPQAFQLEAPCALLHAGLGPGDTYKHGKGRPLWFLKALADCAKKAQIHLRSRKSSLDIVIEAVRALESYPYFNAGKGAKLQADGRARLSASVMTGEDQRMGAVSNLRGIASAVDVAMQLRLQMDRLLAGDDATRFALTKGIVFDSPETPHRYEEYLQKKSGQTGTVGCVALDSDFSLAAATSTGGRGMESPGRVSDSFTPTGNFANRWAAISCTGVGEDILEAGLAVAIATRVEDGAPLEDAIARSFAAHSHRKFGLIALDRRGRGLAHAVKGTLAFAIVTPKKILVGLEFRDYQAALREI